MQSLGGFVWYELMTSDLDPALDFYTHVIGWNAVDSGMPGHNYMILRSGERQVGGAFLAPPLALENGARPGWIGYVGVEDVDAAAKKAASLGATIHKGPEDIPGVGRYCVIGDPQGAPLTLFRAAAEPGDQTSPQPGTPGTVGWHELMANDWLSVFDFYAQMFGWKRDQSIPMGTVDIYELFSHQGEVIGGMVNKPTSMPRCSWLFYVNVDSIAAALERVSERHGKVMNGPMQVPGGSWIAQCIDPQGAMFAMVSNNP